MRILLVGPVPRDVGGSTTGGIATHVWGLATHLAARGHAVAVAADNVDAASGPASVQGVTIFGVHAYSGLRAARRLLSRRDLGIVSQVRRRLGPGWGLRWVARSVAAYDAAISDLEPDVIHVHALEGRFTLVSALAGARVPLVATVHSTHYFEHADRGVAETRRGLVAQNLANAGQLVFVSAYLENRYRALFPGALDDKRIQVVHNPIDASLYAPVERTVARTGLRIVPNQRVLLFAGNLIPRKAPLAFVQAVAALRARGLDVMGVVVGDGPEEVAVRQAVDDLGLEGSLRMDGFRPQAELAAYYSAADVFVLPSLQESFGLVALEAMLCGCPVVGTPEVLAEVVPAESGICVGSFEVADLADALEAALSRDWDREAIRQRVLSSDWSSRVGDYEDLYSEASGA